MNRETIGAIDIGSNAIRLQIRYIEQEGKSTDKKCSVSFKKAAFIRVPIRLGEDVFTMGKIGDEKRDRLTEAMKAFRHLLNTYNAKQFRACATSAMREAANGNDIVKYIAKNSGINIDIISGVEEAETIFEAGDIAGLMGSDKCYMYMDVGGGSTEITIYNNHKRIDSRSFPLGTVRMINNAVDENENILFKLWLKEMSIRYNPVAIVGSGGNINKIHKLLLKKEREVINYLELKRLYEELKPLSYEERIRNLGLNTYRADVIMPAMKLFITASKICKIDEIIVPKIGLADGIIHKLYSNAALK